MIRVMRLLLPLTLITAIGCTRSFPVYDVKKLKPEGGPALQKDYLFYALPRTVLTIDVPVTKIDVDPKGPCVARDDLRKRLLLDDPPQAAKTTFKAGKPVIGSRAEPDPNEVYAVDLRFRAFALTSGSFELTDNSVLTTASISQEDQSVDTVLNVAKLALMVAGATPVAAAAPGGTPSNQPAADVCEDTVRAIREIRTRRLQLISDSIRQESPSEAYLNAVLAKLDESEEALTAAFVGTTTKTVATIQCTLRPTAFDTEKTGKGLFYFSPVGGPVSYADGPCVVPSSIAGKGPSPVLVTAHITPDGAQLADTVRSVRRPITQEARGFFYRIPASAVVSVNFGDDPRARDVKMLAQLGTTTTLPTLGGAFVRKAAMAPTLNAAGGLQKLVLNGEPGGNAAITGVSGLVTDVLKAREEEEKAKAAARDELTQLERERKILEERQKIAEAKKKLAELEGQQP